MPLTHPQRRTVLKTAAGLALMPAPGLAQTPPPAARKGDFDFLTGEWRIAHRRQNTPGDWDVFEGEATCWGILDGAAHVEELRIPARDFSGMGLRTLDAANGVWIDYWMNAKVGVMGGEGTSGRFIDGDGVFDSPDTDDAGPMIVRGQWDQITGQSHRWRQGVSRDGGATWDWNWIMDWTRA